jgi:hypothetical protein
MKKFVGLSIIFLGASISAFAGDPTPEIDASTGAAAIALVSGGLMVLRSRRKK